MDCFVVPLGSHCFWSYFDHVDSFGVDVAAYLGVDFLGFLEFFESCLVFIRGVDGCFGAESC